MQIARGVGSTIAAIKDEIFSGRKLLPVGAGTKAGRCLARPLLLWTQWTQERVTWSLWQWVLQPGSPTGRQSDRPPLPWML